MKPSIKEMVDAAVNDFAGVLRKWWAFDRRQQHMHTWHSREDFIEQSLPALLTSITEKAVASERARIRELLSTRRDTLENIERAEECAYLERNLDSLLTDKSL